MPIGPEIKEVVASQYRIEALLSEADGCRLHLASDPGGDSVVLRTYMDFEEVKRRPKWQALREAFESGAPLPELLAAPGVTPLLNLAEDPRYGPVVVTAWLGGGTLAARARDMSGTQLVDCFAQVASVLAQAHALGVAFGRFTPEDVALDALLTPHLDLSVAAFADALDVRPSTEGSPLDSDGPSPAGDVWWLGRAMQACVPSDPLEPGADMLVAVSQDCVEGDPRPTAADVHRRLRTSAPARAPQSSNRWPAVIGLAVATVGALAIGWVVGGLAPATDGPPAASAVNDDERVTRGLSEADAAIASGAWLQAGQVYRRLVAETDDPRAQRAWEALRQQRAFQRSLKDLKKRLASATEVTPLVRRDVDMLRVLQPDSLVLKHWLSRMAENQEPAGP